MEFMASIHIYIYGTDLLNWILKQEYNILEYDFLFRVLINIRLKFNHILHGLP